MTTTQQNTNEQVQRFKSIQEEGLKLYTKKNHDYGDAFDKSLDEDGLVVAKIRLKDKIRRFETLLKADALVHESIEDTLLDLANYAIMTISWLQKQKH
jgi:hypothetical protein